MTPRSYTGEVNYLNFSLKLIEAVRTYFPDAKLTRTRCAKLAGMHQDNMCRLLNDIHAHHRISIKQLFKVLDVLGYEVCVTIKHKA